MMIEKPMLMSAPMVRALLAGTKTQTRRVIPGRFFARYERWVKECGTERRNRPKVADTFQDFGEFNSSHPVGSRIWCKETFWRWGKWVGGTFKQDLILPRCIIFDEEWESVADERRAGAALRSDLGWHKRPSIYMPRKASRITLEVTAVRVERLQDISEADAKAEGADPFVDGHGTLSRAEIDADPGFANFANYRDGYRILWDSIHGDASWPANPFVWVFTFRKL